MRDQGLAVRFTREELAFARELGGGSGGRGIRRALHFVRILRLQKWDDCDPVWEVARSEEEKVGPDRRDGVIHPPKNVDNGGAAE